LEGPNLEKVSNRIRIRIRVKVRIRIRIKVKSRIRIRVRIKVMRIPNTATKDVQATREVFISQKRTSSTSKLDTSSLLWDLLPSWIWIPVPIRIQPTKMIADP